jgi:hypothetical protein
MVTGTGGRWKRKLIGWPDTRYWLLVTVAVLALERRRGLVERSGRAISHDQ